MNYPLPLWLAMTLNQTALFVPHLPDKIIPNKHESLNLWHNIKQLSLLYYCQLLVAVKCCYLIYFGFSRLTIYDVPKRLWQAHTKQTFVGPNCSHVAYNLKTLLCCGLFVRSGDPQSYICLRGDAKDGATIGKTKALKLIFSNLRQ